MKVCCFSFLHWNPVTSSNELPPTRRFQGALAGWAVCLLWEHRTACSPWQHGLKLLSVHFWEPSQRLPAASGTILNYDIVFLLLLKRIGDFGFTFLNKKCILSRKTECLFHQNMFSSSVRESFMNPWLLHLECGLVGIYKKGCLLCDIAKVAQWCAWQKIEVKKTSNI